MAGEKNKLKGAFDLLFLFGRGIEQFSGSRAEALKSLLIPLALLPVGLAFSLRYPPKGMEQGFSAVQILGTAAAHEVLSFGFGVFLVWGIIWALGRLEHFWLFLAASNWTSLAASLVTLPIVAFAVFGWAPREQLDRVLVLVTCYGYVVTGCIAWRAFKINWQLAGFIAIATLFAGQESWNLLYAVQAIPDPWG